MISVLSTNITSPLGFTTEENYRAVRAGHSALRCYEGVWGLPEPFAASLFSEAQNAALALDGYTRFESLAIRSVCDALSYVQLDITSPRVVLILSTTKGGQQDAAGSPSEAALAIAKAIGLTTMPVVVCNACVSGLSAQLLADRLLSAGFYDYAIAVGAEVQGKFIVSGFQSLKAVSEMPCRPFDIERNGLNPGEAAATIIYGRTFNGQCSTVNGQWSMLNAQWSMLNGQWSMLCGACCNDAYHIVSPSPQGDGLANAIESVMENGDRARLATVCVHGTGTLYNDQMESKAIRRSGLSDVPLTALKGYYGHTMGAAGVLETILTMRATDDGIVLPAEGFTELGVSEKVCISNTPLPLAGDKTSFLKLISGFGGCNVAALYAKGPASPSEVRSALWQKTQTVKITATEVLVCGRRIPTSEVGEGMLTEIYRKHIGNYPKFYKMDILSRLAFLAAELLKKESLSIEGEVWRGSPIILFNRSSSIVADRQFLATISDADNFFPSPAAFVYTLPNITAGEIAIRHHICGETSFYILPERDEALMQQILDASLRTSNARSVISGWVDAESETSFECEISMYRTTK